MFSNVYYKDNQNLKDIRCKLFLSYSWYFTSGLIIYPTITEKQDDKFV